MPDFIVTRVRGIHIFTPLGIRALGYWTSTYEDSAGVGHHNIVADPGHACRIIEDLNRAEFVVEFVDA